MTSKPKVGDLIVQRKIGIGNNNKIKSFGVVTRIVDYKNQVVECFWSDINDTAFIYFTELNNEFSLIKIK